MANIYVRSTDGSDSDNGSTWALAKASIAGADAIDAAGDAIYVSQSHSEAPSVNTTWSFAGVPSNPTRLLCGTDSAAPPTALEATASIALTGSTTLTINGSVHAEGFIFSANTISIGNGLHSHKFKNCKFRVNATGISGQLIQAGQSFGVVTVFEDCSFKFAHASNVILLTHNTVFRGGSAEAGTVTPTALFRTGSGGRGGSVLVEAFDFSGFATGVNLVEGGANNTGSSRVIFRNCKLPASWSGALSSSAISSPGSRTEMHNCDSGDTNYRLWVETYSGSIKNENTIVKTSGASDGTTAFSWKMATNASANYIAAPLASPEISKWNDTVGSAITTTIEIVHDSLTALKDDEVWVEVQYLGTSGVPISTIAKDCKATVISTAADQTTSSVAWTTTGITNVNKQKLSVTFTPQEKGFLQATVYLAKASTTVYVDPVITVS